MIQFARHFIRAIPSKSGLSFRTLSTQTKDGFVVNQVVTKVNEYSTIKINCDYNLIIRPYDLIDCPGSDQLRATLLSNTPQEDGKVDVQVANKNVTVVGAGKKDKLTCVLEVPVKADLDITTLGNIKIESLFSDNLKATAAGNITTRNLQGFEFDFSSEGGDIHCAGLTLANRMEIRVKGDGNIKLEKMQGDLMHVIGDSGVIETNSSYVESSKFVSLNGKLFLKNVHKTAEVYLLEGGEVDMTGFHGTLQAKMNGGKINFQLTELYGDSIILANEPESFVVNISDFVEAHTRLEINAKDIILEDTLADLKDSLIDKNTLKHGDDLNENRLLVSTESPLTLGKLSWMDSVKRRWSDVAKNGDTNVTNIQ